MSADDTLFGNSEFGYCSSRKKKDPLFFHLKSHFQLIFFYSKYLENTIETLLNQYMATKKPQTAPEPEIHLKQKFFPSSDMLFYVFSR